MADASVTCYAVTATVDGKPVEGYILGDKLPAIADFERQRREAALAAAEIRRTAETPAAIAPASQDKPRRPVFGDFSAVDMKGKAVTLKDMRGKVLVICFWTPTSSASIRELLAVSRSFFKLHKQGLDVVGVSLSASRKDIEDALEGSMAFPDIPDRFGIAERHGVSYGSVPRTFILDERHEIVAAGLHGAALEAAIRSTLKGE